MVGFFFLIISGLTVWDFAHMLIKFIQNKLFSTFFIAYRTSKS